MLWSRITERLPEVWNVDPDLLLSVGHSVSQPKGMYRLIVDVVDRRTAKQNVLEAYIQVFYL